MVKLFGRSKAEQTEAMVTDDLGRKAVIDVRDITRTYEMGEQTLQVLKGITLQIYEGEFVSIMGPSGSGKSTLMNILGALDRPSSGEYYLDGVDVSKMSETELAEVRNRKIGFVFQSFNLLKRTSAMRQVELPLIYAGASNRTKRAKASLEAVGLGDRLDHLPSELSGGQQQRVAIARSIVTEPAMILADEPTGNLDSKSGTEVMQIFQRLNRERNITTVFVTHDPWIARHTGRVIMIRDGRVVADHLIAAPLTAGEQERPSDDAELAGLLEEGYSGGHAGQAVITVEPPKPAPVPAQAAATTIETAAVAAPIPFDDGHQPVETAATVEAPRVVVEPAAATMVTPVVAVEPPTIPFDDVMAPIEELPVETETIAEPVETPLSPFDDLRGAAMVTPVEPPAIEPPTIPFDDVMAPVEAAPVAAESTAEPVEKPTIPFDDVTAAVEVAPIEPETAAAPVETPLSPFDDVTHLVESALVEAAPAIPFDMVVAPVETTPGPIQSAAAPIEDAPITPYDEVTNPALAAPVSEPPLEPPQDWLDVATATDEPAHVDVESVAVLADEPEVTPVDQSVEVAETAPLPAVEPVEARVAPVPETPVVEDIAPLAPADDGQMPIEVAVTPTVEDFMPLAPVDDVQTPVEVAVTPAVEDFIPLVPVDDVQAPVEVVVTPAESEVEAAADPSDDAAESTQEPDFDAPISRADFELFEPDFLSDNHLHANGAHHALNGGNHEPDFLMSEPTTIHRAPDAPTSVKAVNAEPDFLTSEPTTIRRAPVAPSAENAEPDFLAHVDLSSAPAASAPLPDPAPGLPFDDHSEASAAAPMPDDDVTAIEPSPLADWLYEPDTRGDRG